MAESKIERNTHIQPLAFVRVRFYLQGEDIKRLINANPRARERERGRRESVILPEPFEALWMHAVMDVLYILLVHIRYMYTKIV